MLVASSCLLAIYLLAILFVIASKIICKITKNESLSRKTVFVFMIVMIICNFILMIFSFIEKNYVHISTSVILAMTSIMTLSRYKKEHKGLKNSLEKRI